MNYALILSLLGKMLRVEAVFMLAPLVLSLFYGGESAPAFLYSLLITAGCSLPLALPKPRDKSFRPRDAFAAAALSWIAFSVFGALPFWFSGVFPHFTDCLFESVSGFATTGATVALVVEDLPMGILFWRSLSHWIGGLGVLLFMMAVLPSLNASAVNLLRAESTGPSPDRVLPKLRSTAKVMYIIYIAMTLLLVILLLITGLKPFDAVTYSFTVAGTGGFANSNAGVSGFGNPAAEMIMAVFMLLFGVNFPLYILLLRKQFKQFFADEELRFYGLLVLASVLLVTINTFGLYDSPGETLRTSFFQVSSLITTTGLYTADYSLWPAMGQAVIFLLMFTGCCAGSTGGGLKLSRVLLLLKMVKIELHKIIHPQGVKVLTMNGKKVNGDVAGRIGLYFFAYMALGMITLFIIAPDGKDMTTNITSVVAMLSNIGPGLGAFVGPTGNYGFYSPLSKTVLSFCMLAGRLEFFPLLVLFMPSLWKRQTKRGY